MTSTSSSTDRIEKKVLLRASRERVWRAISDAKEFGAWFGVDFEGPFVPGARLTGKIVPTKADPEIAKTQKAYEGAEFEIWVDRIEPTHHFSFQWHPFAVDKGVDYSKETRTVVSFELEDTEGGTMLTIRETGFDSIPLARRAKAFAMNDSGWTAQAALVEKYLRAVT